MLQLILHRKVQVQMYCEYALQIFVKLKRKIPRVVDFLEFHSDHTFHQMKMKWIRFEYIFVNSVNEFNFEWTFDPRCQIFTSNSSTCASCQWGSFSSCKCKYIFGVPSIWINNINCNSHSKNLHIMLPTDRLYLILLCCY